MTQEMIQLVARPLWFGALPDELAFDDWLVKLRKRGCIVHSDGRGNAMLIDVPREPIEDNCLRELLALFERFGFEMSQLAVFENASNRPWFRDPTSYWHAKVFGQGRGAKRKYPKELIARSVNFLSALDQEAFADWLDRTNCVVECRAANADRIIVLKGGAISDACLRSLIALFDRYEIEMTQLAAFETSKNRSWFRHPQKYWYAGVFGPGEREAERKQLFGPLMDDSITRARAKRPRKSKK